MKLETNRLLLKTLDLNLIEAAAQRDTQAIEALGYKTNGEWPGPDFFEALPYFRELLIKNSGTKSHLRKGYCFEAVQRLLNWASIQDAVKCIIARCEPDNIGSKKVLGKLDFKSTTEMKNLFVGNIVRRCNEDDS